MESLEHKIGYTFQDRSLLQESLTHSSYANERHGRVRCNERMEFLGDAVLSIVSAELLYTRFPDMPEGQLSKLRSALVCTQSLAGFAAQIDLGGKPGQTLGAHQRRAQLGQLTLRHIREPGVQQLCRHNGQHRVPQELHTLVATHAAVALVGVAGMGQ